MLLLLLLLLLKSVEFDDDVALLLSVAGLVVGPHVTSESEIGSTDSAALRTSWTCLRLCGSCMTSCTSFFRASDPAIYKAPETSITDSSPYIPVACQRLQVTWLNVALEEICFGVVDEAFLCKAFQFAIRIYSIRYANRFEWIRFIKKSAFRFTSCHTVFLAYLLYSLSKKADVIVCGV